MAKGQVMTPCLCLMTILLAINGVPRYEGDQIGATGISGAL